MQERADDETVTRFCESSTPRRGYHSGQPACNVECAGAGPAADRDRLPRPLRGLVLDPDAWRPDPQRQAACRGVLP